jgi:hypothetical protein
MINCLKEEVPAVESNIQSMIHYEFPTFLSHLSLSFTWRARQKRSKSVGDEICLSFWLLLLGIFIFNRFVHPFIVLLLQKRHVDEHSESKFRSLEEREGGSLQISQPTLTFTLQRKIVEEGRDWESMSVGESSQCLMSPSWGNENDMRQVGTSTR